jgi:hypothetical protein
MPCHERRLQDHAASNSLAKNAVSATEPGSG